MEIIRGKQTSLIDVLTLTGCETVHLDIGTGDGRFVAQLAAKQPQTFVIGIDANRDNLREVSRRARHNALFVIANAQSLPHALDGLAAQVSINFPWGSLIEFLLADDPGLMDGLNRVMCPNALLELRLNGGALSEAGWTLEAGANRVRQVLMANGFAMQTPQLWTADALKSCPTTWAKRLAFGRDPRAMYLRGVKIN